MVEKSLRERTRARRRATIERAAMRLFAEHGYDATTVADIAAAAEVSPRTVAIYFPTKLDLALASGDASARRLEAMLDKSGDGETVIELLIRFVEHELFEESESLALRRAMFLKNPQLANVSSDVGTQTYDAMKVKLAKELGLEADDFVVTLVGASITGVIQALLEVDPATQDVPALFGVAVHLLDSWVQGARAAV